MCVFSGNKAVDVWKKRKNQKVLIHSCSWCSSLHRFPLQNWPACVSYITAVCSDKILQLQPQGAALLTQIHSHTFPTNDLTHFYTEPSYSGARRSHVKSVSSVQLTLVILHVSDLFLHFSSEPRAALWTRSTQPYIYIYLKYFRAHRL